MKNEKFTQIISSIDEKYTDEATAFALNKNREAIARRSEPVKQSPKHSRRVRWGVLAACLALFLVVGITATSVAVEAEEYKTAITFFNENGLSAEGLSRSEIKAVYRDITTNSFTYGKTAEVLQKVVPGWEIEQDEPTPEELAALWDRNVWMKKISPSGIDYRVATLYAYDYNRGFEVFDKSVLECYRDGTMLWSTDFTAFYVDGYAYTKDGTAVWGSNATFSSGDTSYGWVALVDNAGNVKWQQRLNHSFKNEYVASVLNNGDGTLAVISRGDLKYLCLSSYDLDGKERAFHKTEVGNYGIQNAARLGDGYIIQLWNQISGDTALLCKMNRDGELIDNFSYTDDLCDYYITDMIEFEGQVYLSAYAVPKQEDEGGRHEIAGILDYVFSKGTEGFNISGEELTPIVRDNYTALLLLCDPEGGTPQTFYSVKGSMGDKLAVNKEGKLEWNVKSIITTFYSPATSSFTIGGNCKVFRYTFDTTGSLIGQTETGETVPYRR